ISDPSSLPVSFWLPDPFAKVVVDGSGQCHSTDTVKSTLDPKWNQHYDL
uniref:C2 domain-containing protein n=1 Tax=Oncorhynchus kisutch TaxID=8019 RepID=A0A8C7MIL7_ONCKI